jgi:exopolysaccharide production protein ExoZ
MLFYVAFALVLAGLKKGVLTVFVACLILGAVTDSAVAMYLGSPLILEFLAGVAIARLRPPERLGVPLVVLGLAWIAMSPLDQYARVMGDGTFERVAHWGIPAALIVYGARGLERLFARKAFDVPVMLGDASYSIYLFHPFVVNIGIAPAIGLSIVLGLLAHRLIERPLNELRRKWRPGRLAAEPAVAA